MKTKKFDKRLVLAKMTVTNLTPMELSYIKGGKQAPAPTMVDCVSDTRACSINFCDTYV